MSQNLPSKDKIKIIRADLEDALNAVGKKHGIESIKLGTIRFDEDGFKVPLEANFVGGDSADLKTLKQNARILGFKPEIAGASIKYGGKDYIVTGLRRTKLTLEKDGKTYTGSVDQILTTLKLQKSPLVIDLTPTFEQFHRKSI